jgi:hypothetical protein
VKLCSAGAHARALIVVACVTGCGGPLDVGRDDEAPPEDALPLGPNNPVILLNDSVYDNWHGEYALLLANTGGPPVAGIIVSTGGMWMDLDANVEGWQALTESARSSGLDGVPEPVTSQSSNLQTPESADIDDTLPNESAGATFIVEKSRRLFEATAEPVVIAVGGRFTDVADAYLIDPSVTERVIVVASAGSSFGDEGITAPLGRPNGEMDAWASTIVTQKFTYIQVGAHYDQLLDVPEARVEELPDHPLGTWMGAKQPEIAELQVASDQVSVLIGGVADFASEFARVSPTTSDDGVPAVQADPNGKSFLVTAVDGELATERLWEMLLATQ